MCQHCSFASLTVGFMQPRWISNLTKRGVCTAKQGRSGMLMDRMMFIVWFRKQQATQHLLRTPPHSTQLVKNVAFAVNPLPKDTRNRFGFSLSFGSRLHNNSPYQTLCQNILCFFPNCAWWHFRRGSDHPGQACSRNISAALMLISRLWASLWLFY